MIYDEKDSIDNIKSIKYQQCPLDRKKGKDVQTPNGAQEIGPMACSPCHPGWLASGAENAHCPPRGTFCINVHFLMQTIRYKSRNLSNDGSRTATRWSKFRLPIWSNMILVSWMVVMTTMTYKDNTDRELEGCVYSFSSVWNTIKCNTVWQHDPTRTRVGCQWLHASSTRMKHVAGTTTRDADEAASSQCK